MSLFAPFLFASLLFVYFISFCVSPVFLRLVPFSFIFVFRSFSFFISLYFLFFHVFVFLSYFYVSLPFLSPLHLRGWIDLKY